MLHGKGLAVIIIMYTHTLFVHTNAHIIFFSATHPNKCHPQNLAPWYIKGLAVIHYYVYAHTLFVHTNRLSIKTVYACACS